VLTERELSIATHIVCRNCGYRIPLSFRLRTEAPIHFVVACPSCGYRGVYSYADVVEEGVYRYTCEVCSTRLYSFRTGYVKCPACNSKYCIASNGSWKLIEKGSPPQKTQQSPVAIGAVLGGLSAASKGKDSLEKLANTILGALAGMVLGSIVGALVEALSSVEREVIYEAT
jgi:DNA-directed RNA polymerase subunit RPC12/RpoP